MENLEQLQGYGRTMQGIMNKYSPSFQAKSIYEYVEPIVSDFGIIGVKVIDNGLHQGIIGEIEKYCHVTRFNVEL